MGFQRLLLFGFMYAMVMPSSSLKLLNLRRYRAEGTVGRFVVPREKLEVVIRDRINQDNQCGNFVGMSLPKSLPAKHYNESLFGEVTIVFGTIEDKELDYLPCDKKDQLNSSYRGVQIYLPLISNGKHGLLTLVDMTEAKARLTPPLMTNDQYRMEVDAIDENGENVTLHKENDEMTLVALKNTSCQTDENVGDDFDEVHGTNLTITNYPEAFDWNCGSVLDWDTGYCRVLKDNLCEIQRFGGDVCMQATTSRSVRCPSTMQITSASGIFHEILSGMFDAFPVKSFEAEWIDRDHDAGIQYPCLSKEASY